jgi:pimeloyl-ACP methyl ester carboxylesterase
MQMHLFLALVVTILAQGLYAAQTIRVSSLPELKLIDTKTGPKGNQVLVYKHKAVSGMDSPGYVAKGYEHGVSFMLPAGWKEADQTPRALMVSLHGFGDSVTDYASGVANWFADNDAFIMAPNDPLGTWFYGYSDQLPDGDPNKGMVVNYTERRILAYLEHFISKYPIDRTRVFVTGGSMGGTGTTSLALRYPEIFAGGDGKKGATNRAYCHWKQQCETIWGKYETGVLNNEGVNVWDWQNIAWYLQHHHEKSNWIRTYNGKEDVSIPFRQLAGPPGVTPMSFYTALETFGIGHVALWDGSSHSKPDPKSSALDDWWDPFSDATCYLRANLSFPAFSKFSKNDNPGTGAGDAVGTDNDLGNNTYDGDPAGGLNRFLRWNSNTIRDTATEWSIEIKLSSGNAGYKGGSTETVNVTPRRLQKFPLKPGAAYTWKTGSGESGRQTADADGVLTIQGVRVSTDWKRLTVTMAP